LSECGYFVSGNADGSFVVVLDGPAHPIALVPISNTTARNARDLVIASHLLDARIALPVPADRIVISGTAVAAHLRQTMVIRESQWPREFLDKRLRTTKGIAKRRRNTSVLSALRRRIAPRPRSAVVTPIA